MSRCVRDFTLSIWQQRWWRELMAQAASNNAYVVGKTIRRGFCTERLVFISTLARTSDTHRTPMLSALSLPARCCKLATIPQHLRRIPAIKRSFIYKQKEVAHPTEQRCGRQRRQNCYYYKLFFIIHFPYYKLEILYYSMRNATAICRNRHIHWTVSVTHFQLANKDDD